MKKEYEKRRKEVIKQIEEDYVLTVKGLEKDYKDEFRDYKKLRSLAGNVESPDLQEKYKQYLIDQTNKDINKTQKQIDKKQKQIDKIDAKIDKLYDETGDTSKTIPEEYTQQKSTES